MGRTYTICGIMTQPDSQALFLNNSDFTVNTITYGVAEVTDAGFAALEDAGGAPAYTYSFAFTDRDLPTADRIDAEQDMVEALTDADTRVDDLIDADSNQGIGYARDDVDGDSMMWMTLLDIIIVIMAFVLWSYRRHHRGGERHHRHAARQRLSSTRDRAALPGTSRHRGRGRGAFGHCARHCVLYRAHAQSLLRFVQPAALPGVLELGDLCEVRRGSRRRAHPHHAGGLLRKMGKTPLQFLRHEASGKSGTKRGLQLPERMGFVSRFRLRIFLRNLGNFATLFVGIAFASLLLLFGLAILPTMTHYADNLETSLVAEHQYTLKAPLELEGTAEEREQWSALERLQSVDGALLSAAQDASDELDDAADAAQAAADAAASSPSAESLAAAQDALASVQDKKDALYARLDDLADALGCDRDEAIDLIDRALKSTPTTTTFTRSTRPTTARTQSRRQRNMPFTSCSTTVATEMGRRRFPSTASRPIRATGKGWTSATDTLSLAAACSTSLAGAKARRSRSTTSMRARIIPLNTRARTAFGALSRT